MRKDGSPGRQTERTTDKQFVRKPYKLAPQIAEWEHSKLEAGRCQVQTPVALVDLAFRSFPWFSPKLA